MKNQFDNEVKDSERFSRWVYRPRFIDASGILSDRFITLRPQLHEEGISGQLYDRVGREVVIKEGVLFVHKDKNGNPKEELVAISKALVSEIRELSQDNDIIDVVSVPSAKVSHHAEIRFKIDGVDFMADRNVMDARLQDYFDQIRMIMSENLDFVS